jgi:large subunit ribosomal protein L1
MELKDALKQLRSEEKRKFDQSIDLIINLRGIDLRKDNISTIINIQHPIKEKKICGFLTKKSDLVRTITQPDFQKYKEKNTLKKIVREFDFFIAHASLMPSVASTFGKALGPTGKMPSPQLGIIAKEDDATIKLLLDKIAHSVKVKLKEPSFKISIGKESMKDEQIIDNILAVYNGLVNALPTKRENVKSVLLKLTMGKPIKVEMK